MVIRPCYVGKMFLSNFAQCLVRILLIENISETLQFVHLCGVVKAKPQIELILDLSSQF